MSIYCSQIIDVSLVNDILFISSKLSTLKMSIDGEPIYSYSIIQAETFKSLSSSSTTSDSTISIYYDIDDRFDVGMNWYNKMKYKKLRDKCIKNNLHKTLLIVQ